MSSPSPPIPNQAIFLGGDDDATMSVTVDESPREEEGSKDEDEEKEDKGCVCRL